MDRELPNSWKVEDLGDVVDVLDNLRKPINSTERQGRITGKSMDQLYPYYGATGQVGWIDRYLTDGEYILVGEDGAPFLDLFKSKAYKIKGKTWVNNHAHVLKGKPNVTLNDFVLYYLNSINYREYVNGTTRLKLTKGSLVGIPFPVPGITEQHQIVEKIEELFSELDKGIENLKTAQQQLKVYRQAVLKWAFEGKLTEDFRSAHPDLKSSGDILLLLEKEREKLSRTIGKKTKALTPINEEEMKMLPDIPNLWNWVKLGDHSFVTKLAGFEFTKYVNYSDGGEIPVIRAQNVAKEKFIPRNFYYISRDIMEKLPRSRVYGGEILMVFVGAGLGNVGIVPEKQEYFLGPNVAKIALEDQFYNKYIHYFLCSQLGFLNVTGMSKATAQGSISMGNIREVSVPLISIEEQHEIVQEIESRLSVCDKMEETITTSMQQAEALRQSILKRAFEGKLVKRNAEKNL